METTNNQTTATESSAQRLLRIQQVSQLTGLSKAKIYNLISENQFPRPIKIGERVALWPETVVQAWIADLIEKTQAAA